jgi:gas vesicle protein
MNTFVFQKDRSGLNNSNASKLLKEMINMSITTKSSGLLLGTLIGGAIGAVSAFLLAPKSGAKLREDIVTKYRAINDKMQQMTSAVGEKTHEMASSVGQKTQSLAGNVSDHTSKLADRVSEVKGNIVDKTSEVKDNVVNAWQDSKEEVKREAESQRQPFSSYNKN